jgi:hypothetical protein
VKQLRHPLLKPDAIGYAKFCSRSHDAVIRVYDKAGKVIQTGIKFNEKSFRFTTQMRDFTTIDVTVFATKMIPLLRAGFNWNSPISLIGIRAALEPSPAENRMDVYDDIILRVIDGSITQWVTSTDPSKALVMTPIKGQKYAAQLCKGIYLFQKHMMHGKYPCLGQAEDVGIERLNRDGTVNHTEKGPFGICIHSGGAGMNTGRFSAGCQIIDNPDGYFRDPTWSNFWLPIRNGMKEHDLPTIPYMLVDVGDLG